MKIVINNLSELKKAYYVREELDYMALFGEPVKEVVFDFNGYAEVEYRTHDTIAVSNIELDQGVVVRSHSGLAPDSLWVYDSEYTI